MSQFKKYLEKIRFQYNESGSVEDSLKAAYNMTTNYKDDDFNKLVDIIEKSESVENLLKKKISTNIPFSAIKYSGEHALKLCELELLPSWHSSKTLEILNNDVNFVVSALISISKDSKLAKVYKEKYFPEITKETIDDGAIAPNGNFYINAAIKELLCSAFGIESKLIKS